MHNSEINEIANEILQKCSIAAQRDYQSSDIQKAAVLFRVAYNFEKGATIIDLGGGLSPVNAILSALGMNVVVYDLLSVYWDNKYHTAEQNKKIFQTLENYGVSFVEKNLETLDLTELHGSNSIDRIVTHHCIEHFHNSPRKLLESALTVIKPSGNLVIEVPNAANLLKRIKLLMGRTNYTDYSAFYGADQYYGHIREYTTHDLLTLAKLLQQEDFKIFGTNYLGLEKLPNALRIPVDKLLKLRPGLCASLYLDISKH